MKEIKVLDKGRVHLEYGPLSMVIGAWDEAGEPMSDVCLESCLKAEEYLQEMGARLPELKKSWTLWTPEPGEKIPCLMWEAVKLTGDHNLTPMAAVAGVMSDLLSDWLVSRGAAKVIVNNGGDVALRLQEGGQTRVGVVNRIADRGISHTVSLSWRDNVGGIATSGLGGRSFTQGIADAVTVFATNCRTADAFATSLANASCLDSLRIKRALARELDPATDIPELLVTTFRGELTPEEIEQGLKQIVHKAEKAVSNSQIFGVIANIQGNRITFPERFFAGKLFEIKDGRI